MASIGGGPVNVPRLTTKELRADVATIQDLTVTDQLIASAGLSFPDTNVPIGKDTLNPSSIENVLVGYNINSSIGDYNTIIGSTAGVSFTNLNSSNVIVGGYGDVLSGTDQGVVILGVQSKATNSGVSVGYQAGANSTSAALRNTFIGYLSVADSPTAGGSYTAVNSVICGYQAGRYLIGGNSQTAVGYTALRGDATNGGSGGSNTAIGNSVLAGFTTASNCTGVGNIALQDVTTGTQLTALGAQAGNSCTDATHSVFLGYQSGEAGTAVTTGDFNVLCGSQSQSTLADLQNAVAIGYNSKAVDDCVIIGSGAGATLNGTETNGPILIGKSSDVGAAGQSGGIVIGTNATVAANGICLSATGAATAGATNTLTIVHGGNVQEENDGDGGPYTLITRANFAASVFTVTANEKVAFMPVTFNGVAYHVPLVA